MLFRSDSLVLQLVDKELATDSLTLDINYDRTNVDNGSYLGATHTDHYGRILPKPARGTTRLDSPTNLSSQLMAATLGLYDQIVDKNLLIRKINLTANRVIADQGIYQIDLFTDTTKLEKEKKLQEAMLSIKKRFGKNSLLKATSLEEGATMRERNEQIGGHKA